MRIRPALQALIGKLQPRRPRPVILMYHRIAEALIDPWDLAVSPDRFAEQLDCLRRSRHPLRLSEFIARLRDGTLPDDAVAVTFDDGYADNFLAAKPLLEAACVPATVFLATGYLGRSRGFWWDELASLLLGHAGPERLELTIGGFEATADLGFRMPTMEDRSWRAASGPATPRQGAYLTIRNGLRLLDEEEREGVMAALRSCFADSTGPALHRAMTRSEVHDLVGGGLIDIGAHTVTHAALTHLAECAGCDEIGRSRQACEVLAEAPIEAFAYPYGEFDDTVRASVKRAGLAFACSTQHGAVGRKSDLFALPRTQVLDWDGDMFEKTLLASVG